MALPPNFEKWAPGFRKAWFDGNRTALAPSATLADCPYEDKRNTGGRITWSRAYIRAWCDGFEAFRAAVQNDQTQLNDADRDT